MTVEHLYAALGSIFDHSEQILVQQRLAGSLDEDPDETGHSIQHDLEFFKRHVLHLVADIRKVGSQNAGVAFQVAAVGRLDMRESREERRIGLLPDAPAAHSHEVQGPTEGPIPKQPANLHHL